MLSQLRLSASACGKTWFELYLRKQPSLTTHDILVFDGDAERDVMPSPGAARLKA
jgi:hypothetical protein